MPEPVKSSRTIFHTLTHSCKCKGKVTIQNWEDTPTGQQRLSFFWYWCDTCRITGRCGYLRDEINQEPTEPRKEASHADAAA